MWEFIAGGLLVALLCTLYVSELKRRAAFLQGAIVGAAVGTGLCLFLGWRKNARATAATPDHGDADAAIQIPHLHPRSSRDADDAITEEWRTTRSAADRNRCRRHVGRNVDTTFTDTTFSRYFTHSKSRRCYKKTCSCTDGEDDEITRWFGGAISGVDQTPCETTAAAATEYLRPSVPTVAVSPPPVSCVPTTSAKTSVWSEVLAACVRWITTHDAASSTRATPSQADVIQFLKTML
jgi:hypothetical protein